MEKTKQKIRTYIKNNFLFGYSEDDIQDDMSFFELGVLDSTGIMELVTYIEREFNIKIEDNEIIPENLDSINLIANFIKKNKDL
ncbi:acyl carrier protein [Blautia producta]|uniref:acyl carrier protein n=1 Tax=Blautia producta TaxID=33035 RepID=UPI00210C7E3A|nr:acyl carrier protein [Blautia producta]MCQ4744257.1 acyl carrier protein [Blautia producta]